MEKAENRLKRIAIISTAALWGLQSIGRLYFYYIYMVGGIGEFLTSPVSQGTLQLMMTIFLLLGSVGLIASAGLLLRKRWGLWCTALATGATIIFDIWGLSIQSSAAIGFIVPALSVAAIYFGVKPR